MMNFESVFTPLPEYPVQRAAERYLATAAKITPEAMTLLRVMAGPAFKREKLADEEVSTTTKEVPMSEATTATPAKRKPKAEAPPPVKTAAGKNGKKVAAAKPVEKDPATRGRAPNIAGSAKIKLLIKDNPKRAAAAERFALYKNGMTVDEYIDAGGKRADINWDVAQQFIEVR